MFEAVEDKCRAAIRWLNSVSLERQCVTVCYICSHMILTGIRMLELHFPDWSNSHVTWQKRFNHLQPLAGKDDTHWQTLYFFAPETSSCPGIEVNWKLIRERLKRGADKLCICTSFDASKVVLIFIWCAKMAPWRDEGRLWPSPSSSSQAANKHELMQKCPLVKCQYSCERLPFHQERYHKQTNQKKKNILSLTSFLLRYLDYVNNDFSFSLKERLLCVLLTLFNPKVIIWSRP